MMPLRYLVLLLLVVLVMPELAVAQTATSSWARYDNSGTTAVQRQAMRGARQSSGLQAKIAELDSGPVLTLPIPVLFGVAPTDLSPNFGDPRDGGTRTHEGEDIIAVKGTPIVSPTAAVVLRVVTGVDEGNAVYTANPGGETFVYMHLDRFGEGVVAGTALAPGSLIGYVGNTGNAAGGPAHLHFEVHNNSGTPTDPFPRLTAEFTPIQKISFLTLILGQTSDAGLLAQLLVTNFRSTFLNALAAGIALPSVITDTLDATASAQSSSGTILPAGDLDVGSVGTAVVTLQKYLIQAATGAAATRLAGAGATGNFGLITKAALIEYQVAVGISPATGYYGPETRLYINAHPLISPQPGGINSTGITRDLERGMTGEDVRTLQKILNTHGYAIAVSGSGAPGSETDYFGPATQAAVVRFQVAHSIAPAVGYVGQITRGALATL